MVKKGPGKKKVKIFLFLFLLLYLINFDERCLLPIHKQAIHLDNCFDICFEYIKRRQCTLLHNTRNNATSIDTKCIDKWNIIKSDKDESAYVSFFFFFIKRYIFWKKKLSNLLLLQQLQFPNIFVSAKVVYGIYTDTDISKLSNFCYLNNSKEGILSLANYYIPDSKLLMLNKTEDELYDYVNNRNGKTCADLEKEALLVKSFNNIYDPSFKSSYVFYETTINPAHFEKNLNFVLSNCGKNFKNVFKIEFRNDINFLKNHFSCEEQGLIEIYMLLMVLLIVLSLKYFRKKNELSEINSSIRESIHCSALFFFLSNLFYFVHILTYAFNGSGFSVLKVLSQIYEAIFDCFMISVIIYIMNESANKAKQKDETFQWSLTYSILKFLYVLFEIQNHQDLNLYTRLRSVVALPFVVVRIIIIVGIHNNTNKMLKEKSEWNDKFFIILEYIVYNSWIMTIPLLFILLRDSSLHFTHLFIHFSNLLILIFVIYNLSQKKHQFTESRHPYLDLK